MKSISLKNIELRFCKLYLRLGHLLDGQAVFQELREYSTYPFHV